MSRVVTQAVKQASLNLKDMVDKKPLGLEVEDLTSDTSLTSSGSQSINGVRTWTKEDHKPEIIQTAIEQIKGMFNVKSEVKSWTASYYPPSMSTVKGSEIVIPPGEKGLGCRFVIVIGTRDIANLSVSTGSINAENPMLMLSGDCLNLKITICPVLSISFKNVGAEKLPARKGFRETIIKKIYSNRHIIVLDGHIEVSDVISHVAKKLIGKSSDDNKTESDDVSAVVSSINETKDS
jgi:hypothetical protein